MDWIENRSYWSRWFLVPIVFIASSSLIHGSVIIASWILSIFWGRDAETNLWFYEIIIANGLSAYCAAMFSGWTAPKFKFVTTCIGSAVYLLGNAYLIYGMLTLSDWWDTDVIWTLISTTVGVIIAILYAKNNFYE
jgi:hypothetical protein